MNIERRLSGSPALDAIAIFFNGTYLLSQPEPKRGWTSLYLWRADSETRNGSHSLANGSRYFALGAEFELLSNQIIFTRSNFAHALLYFISARISQLFYSVPTIVSCYIRPTAATITKRCGLLLFHEMKYVCTEKFSISSRSC